MNFNWNNLEKIDLLKSLHRIITKDKCLRSIFAVALLAKIAPVGLSSVDLNISCSHKANSAQI